MSGGETTQTNQPPAAATAAAETSLEKRITNRMLDRLQPNIGTEARDALRECRAQITHEGHDIHSSQGGEKGRGEIQADW